MRLILQADADKAAHAASEIMAQETRANPQLRIGLAAGRTFAPVYRAFVALAQRSTLSLDAVVWIQLDDYAGLTEADHRVFRWALERLLLDPLGIAQNRRLLLRQTHAPAQEIARHAAAISSARGIDLQLLGLGANGHLAFNEPGSDHRAGARVVELAPPTRLQASQVFPPAPPPRHGMTLGLKEIAEARRVLLVVTGEAKAAPLAQALDPNADPDRPVVALNGHPAFTVLADKAAASLLNGRQEGAA